MTRYRKGSMLLEVSLAVALLTVGLVAVAQLLAVAARQRHETRWRAVATREVANVIEQVMALPWDQTTAAQSSEVALHPAAKALLPDAALEVEVTDVTDPRPAKRIQISLTYRSTADLPVAPIKLVAWKFAPGGAK